jgi:hypothetical protein
MITAVYATNDCRSESRVYCVQRIYNKASDHGGGLRVGRERIMDGVLNLNVDTFANVTEG